MLSYVLLVLSCLVVKDEIKVLQIWQLVYVIITLCMYTNMFA